jgi:hypothetical protein
LIPLVDGDVSHGTIPANRLAGIAYTIAESLVLNVRLPKPELVSRLLPRTSLGAMQS